MKKDELMIEDYERLSELDKMYILEREREIIEEYMEWKEEQDRKKRLPAKIEVNQEKIKKENNA